MTTREALAKAIAALLQQNESMGAVQVLEQILEQKGVAHFDSALREEEGDGLPELIDVIMFG